MINIHHKRLDKIPPWLSAGGISERGQVSQGFPLAVAALFHAISRNTASPPRPEDGIHFGSGNRLGSVNDFHST